jgi:hypothetical protein
MLKSLKLTKLKISEHESDFTHTMVWELKTHPSPGDAAALLDADKRRDYFADHNCPGYAFRDLF